MKIEKDQSILFTGDSITDCRRGRPVGKENELGNGYVAFVASLIKVHYPQRNIEIFNTGVSGDRVIELEKRWKTDVISLSPDWLSIMIGINDVWQYFHDSPRTEFIPPEHYEKIYRKLLEQTRLNLKGLILMTPYMIERDLSEPMRERMDVYGGIVKQLASEFDAIFINIQAEFDAFLQYYSSQSLSNDRIHPNNTGHMLIAKAFLQAVEFDWDECLL